jgi:hypothetical protein
MGGIASMSRSEEDKRSAGETLCRHRRTLVGRLDLARDEREDVVRPSAVEYSRIIRQQARRHLEQECGC